MRRLVLLAVALGLASLLVAGFLGRHHLLERWYLAQLESEDSATRLNAMGRLAEIRSTRAVPALTSLLRRVDDEEKKAILWAYTAMGPHAAEAAPALVKLVDDRTAWRTGAQTALVTTGQVEGAPEGSVDGFAVRALEAIGPAALPVILDADLHGDPDRIQWRMAYFAGTQDWSARYLLDQLASASSRRSAMSKRILRSLGPQIVPRLAYLCSSDDLRLRRWAADVIWDFALGRLRAAEKPPADLGRLIDPALRGADMSRAAVNLAAELVELDERARDALSELWLDRNFSDLRAHAIRAAANDLETAGPWIPHFCSSLASEAIIRSAAFDALSGLGSAAASPEGSARGGVGPLVAELLRALECGDERNRWAQVLLVEIGLRSPEAVTAIEEALPGAGPQARPWIERVLLRVKRAGGK